MRGAPTQEISKDISDHLSSLSLLSLVIIGDLKSTKVLFFFTIVNVLVMALVRTYSMQAHQHGYVHTRSCACFSAGPFQRIKLLQYVLLECVRACADVLRLQEKEGEVWSRPKAWIFFCRHLEREMKLLFAEIKPTRACSIISVKKRTVVFRAWI